MTNEAVLKIETHIPINFTCSTDVTIEKGAICKMENPMTAVLSDGNNDIVGGIVQSEKLAAETSQNSVAIFKGGYFRVTCSGSGSAGESVVTHGNPNVVVLATTGQENILGIMQEDWTEGQTKIMWLNPTRMELS